VNRLDGIDVCVLARGGGSKEDLAVFNREQVCRALGAVRTPTVSAVGHETDTSLTDLVADRRAPTPSAAMEMILPDRADLSRHAAGLASRLAHALGRGTRLGRERVERTADRLELLQERTLERSRQSIGRLAAQLEALSPLRVLERGYSVARDASGQVLRKVAEFRPGHGFRLRVSDGEVRARVEEGA
jgi:exodeoxyribonuclease VII large subunit